MSSERWPVKVQTLPWYGGKAGYGKAEWIASLLPWKKESTYVETHGGAAGVMARRAPVNCEIYNDLDGRLKNWWDILRTRKEDFGWAIQCLPASRELHRWAICAVDDKEETDFDRAVAFHVLATQSMSQKLSGIPTWAATITDAKGSIGRWGSERVAKLADRFWNVQLESIRAEKLLKRLVDMQSAVIYVDPPYPTANTSAYSVCEVDTPELTNLLLEQSGNVAISGFGCEWDHLGWNRYEKETCSRAGSWNSEAGKRTEVLWTNYDAHAEQYLGGLFADYADDSS